jgi:hypothetical protein
MERCQRKGTHSLAIDDQPTQLLGGRMSLIAINVGASIELLKINSKLILVYANLFWHEHQRMYNKKILSNLSHTIFPQQILSSNNFLSFLQLFGTMFM